MYFTIFIIINISSVSWDDDLVIWVNDWMTKNNNFCYSLLFSKKRKPQTLIHNQGNVLGINTFFWSIFPCQYEPVLIRKGQTKNNVLYLLLHSNKVPRQFTDIVSNCKRVSDLLVWSIKHLIWIAWCVQESKNRQEQ